MNSFGDVERHIFGVIGNYVGLESDLYTDSDTETQRLKAYLLGVTDGYIKDNAEAEKNNIEDTYSDDYTNGLMAGIGIERTEEFSNITRKVEEKIKDRRVKLKRMMLGMMYGMNGK